MRIPLTRINMFDASKSYTTIFVLLLVKLLALITNVSCQTTSTARCNECFTNGVACLDEQNFSICISGTPINIRTSCPTGAVCTAEEGICVATAQGGTPVCFVDRCGQCLSARQNFACLDENIYAFCYDGETPDSSSMNYCPLGNVCDLNNINICSPTQSAAPSCIVDTTTVATTETTTDSLSDITTDSTTVSTATSTLTDTTTGTTTASSTETTTAATIETATDTTTDTTTSTSTDTTAGLSTTSTSTDTTMASTSTLTTTDTITETTTDLIAASSTETTTAVTTETTADTTTGSSSDITTDTSIGSTTMSTSTDATTGTPTLATTVSSSVTTAATTIASTTPLTTDATTGTTTITTTTTLGITTDTTTVSTTPSTTHTTTQTTDAPKDPNSFCTEIGRNGYFRADGDITCTRYIYCYGLSGQYLGWEYTCANYFNAATGRCQTERPADC